MLVVYVSPLKAFSEELFWAVGAGIAEVIVGGVRLGEVAPNVGDRAPTLLKEWNFKSCQVRI